MILVSVSYEFKPPIYSLPQNERNGQESATDGEQQIPNSHKLLERHSETQDAKNPNSNGLDDGMGCLANYGAEVEPAIIAHGRGSYIFTVSGKQILDWTSGQVRLFIQSAR